jgi:high-affinity iron transporter
MLETAVITFREGLEMFLIIAITLAYLARTGRSHLYEPVFWGAGVAIALSLTTGWHIADLAQTPMMEGILAITAGVMVASMTWMMMKNARNIRQNIADKIDQSASKTGWPAILGIFGFTVLMIAREGMETAMMLGSMSGAINNGDLFVGALIGFSIVGMVGYMWVKQSGKINLRAFMQVTGIFLILFCVHLFIYGFHELTETGMVPLIDNNYWHNLTEPLEPGEPIGQIITLSMLAVPAGWILINYLRHRLLRAEAAAE